MSWPRWVDVLVSISHFLVTLNSSVNFIIYCYKDQKFRASLRRMLGCEDDGGNNNAATTAGPAVTAVSHQHNNTSAANNSVRINSNKNGGPTEEQETLL